MDKKTFILSLLAKVQHPQDSTNDILLGLEYLVQQNDTNQTIIDAVYDILTIVMQVSKDTQHQAKTQKAIDIITELRRQEHKEKTQIDQSLENMLADI